MSLEINEVLDLMETQNGQGLRDMSDTEPVMIVFLRHFGCLFCMEAMKDIAKQRDEIEGRGVTICMVHMAEDKVADQYFEEYGLGGINHISDPECEYYARFGLVKADFGQLFGLRVWLRSAELAIKDITAIRRKQIGDGFQMPGVFLISKGEILEQYIHARASDRPDYKVLSACCLL